VNLITRYHFIIKSTNLLRIVVCHAEVNAVLNKNSSNVKDCTIYVALFPCNQCAKVIIQSGIKTVIYMSDKYAHKVETIAAKRMFDAAGVKYRCLLFGIVASFISIDRRDLMAYFFFFTFLGNTSQRIKKLKLILFFLN